MFTRLATEQQRSFTYLPTLKVMLIMCRTWIAHKVGLHVRWILLKNIIYLYVQKIHTSPLCKTTQHTWFSCSKCILHTIVCGIHYYVQSRVDLILTFFSWKYKYEIWVPYAWSISIQTWPVSSSNISFITLERTYLEIEMAGLMHKGFETDKRKPLTWIEAERERERISTYLRTYLQRERGVT